LGGHIDACPKCGHRAISYNSCRNRHCPKCQAQAREHWLAARERELLATSYFHVVFTVPHELNVLALDNQRLFLQDQVTATGTRGVSLPLQQNAGPPLSGGPVIPGTVALSAEDLLLRSGLALACANAPCSGPDDGILTALEPATLDLRGTNLVVLSACETGLGDVQNGDGVYGLRRAFVLAGARNQVMSLWKVDDRGTSEFMPLFYRELDENVGTTTALRTVQIRTMQTAERRHPFHWAAFIASGPQSDW
jgi:hypothetical protein